MLRVFSYGAHDANVSLTGLVIAHIYNMSTGLPVLHTTTALTHVTNGGYAVTQDLSHRVPWYFDVGVYTTTTGAALDGNYVMSTGEYQKAQVDVPKNTAFSNFTFPMFDEYGSPATGLAVTAKVSIDGASLTACTNAVSEIGSGKYKINLAAADLNGDFIHLQFTATDTINTEIGLVTT